MKIQSELSPLEKKQIMQLLIISNVDPMPLQTLDGPPAITKVAYASVIALGDCRH